MRVWRESPRIAIATVLAAIIVIGGAGLVGSLLAGSDDGGERKAEKRAQALTSRLDAVRRDLSAARKTAANQLGAQQRANRKLKRARQKTRRETRKIRRLQRQLRRARR